jgi:hypothetical protein
MVLGLKEIQIRGEIRTNVDYTIDLLHVNFSLVDYPILSILKKKKERNAN